MNFQRVYAPIFLLINCSFHSGPVSASDSTAINSFEKTSTEKETLPVQSFLNADGSLMTCPDVNACLNFKGYRINLDSSTGPVLTPSMMTTQWFHVGGGVNSSVREIVINGNDIYVGGSFLDAGGIPDADYAARWDGCHWHAIGPNIDGEVYAIEVDGNDVIVGGDFAHPHLYISRWDGSQWNAYGNGPGGPVYDMVISDGILCVGGGTWNSGFVAEWVDGGWTPLGPVFNGRVNVLAINGAVLHAGGRFSNVDGNPDADGVIKWINSSWQNIGLGIDANIAVGVWDMEFYNGDLYVGGVFAAAGGDPNANAVVKWDGEHWINFGAIPGFWGLHDLAFFEGNLYVTIGAGWANSDGIYRWDFETESWNIFQIMELGADDPLTVLVAEEGNIYVGGFSGMYFEGQYYNSIMRWGAPVLTGTVTNPDDNGEGSLRFTIGCVDEGATIKFDLPSESQITLTSGEIEITKNLIISGPGINELTISGNLSSRVFHLYHDTNLTLNNLSLKEGFYPVLGGAILVQGDLELENVTFRDNFENGNFKHLSIDPQGSLTISGMVMLHH